MTKTRLIPALGAAGAAEVHRHLVLHTVRTLRELQQRQGAAVEVHHTGAPESVWREWLGGEFTYCAQSEGDLGDRMREAFASSFASGAERVVLIGSDCPSITTADLEAAFTALEHTAITLGPATDGGYWLIGLQRPTPTLFEGIPWSTNQVLSESLSVAARLGLGVKLLRTLSDIDRPDDWWAWQRTVSGAWPPPSRGPHSSM